MAAQLARELRCFLGQHSKVELFVSYYDHFVPESFKESSGKYISKKCAVNADIDALRHSATRSLLTRSDVVVVATVSCIYGLGLPEEYFNASVEWRKDQILFCDDSDSTQVSKRDALLQPLKDMHYQLVENDQDFQPGTYQHMVRSPPPQSQNHDRIVQQHQITLWPKYDQYPVSIWVNEHHRSKTSKSASQMYYKIIYLAQGAVKGLVQVPFLKIFPARHHVVPPENLEMACDAIEEELYARIKELKKESKSTEAVRLQERVLEDVYMMRETGLCKGMENYSRHMAGRQPGEPPDTLLNFMANKVSANEDREASSTNDWLLVMDESHVTLPQVSAMYAGDKSRKRSLIENGFRLPSALDNRPLTDEEFWRNVPQTLFVSATPGRKELSMIEGDQLQPVDMMIRPTHVCDPTVEVRPKTKCMQDLICEVHQRIRKQERVLAVTVTKRDSEDLAGTLFSGFGPPQCPGIALSFSSRELQLF